MNEMTIMNQPFSCQKGALTLRGQVYRMNQDDQPIAICMHGFSGTMASQTVYATMLAQMGYAAFTFDFAGGSAESSSDGRFSEMTIFTELEDCLAVLNWAKEQPYTHRGPVLLLGCSQGGVVAALAAAKLKTDVQDLILLFPAFVAADDARRGETRYFSFDPNNIPDLIPSTVKPGLYLSGEYPRSLMNLDFYQEIAPYVGHVLIFQGTKDPVVPFQYAQRAYDTYKANGSIVRLVTIEGGSHGFTPEENKIVEADLKQFLQKTSTPSKPED